MTKLRNPPPKRVKLTKRLGYEALKLLRYIDFRMTMTRDMLDFEDWKRQVSDDMNAVLANMNMWWRQQSSGHGKWQRSQRSRKGVK